MQGKGDLLVSYPSSFSSEECGTWYSKLIDLFEIWTEKLIIEYYCIIKRKLLYIIYLIRH